MLQEKTIPLLLSDPKALSDHQEKNSLALPSVKPNLELSNSATDGTTNATTIPHPWTSLQLDCQGMQGGNLSLPLYPNCLPRLSHCAHRVLGHRDDPCFRKHGHHVLLAIKHAQATPFRRLILAFFCHMFDALGIIANGNRTWHENAVIPSRYARRHDAF